MHPPTVEFCNRIWGVSGLDLDGLKMRAVDPVRTWSSDMVTSQNQQSIPTPICSCSFINGGRFVAWAKQLTPCLVIEREVYSGLFCGADHYLDIRATIQACCNAGAGWEVLRLDPCIPRFVHLSLDGHIRDIDRCGQ